MSLRAELDRREIAGFRVTPVAPAHIQRSASFFHVLTEPVLPVGLNRRNQRAGYLRLLREPLLRELPVLTPNTERGFSLSLRSVISSGMSSSSPSQAPSRS